MNNKSKMYPVLLYLIADILIINFTYNVLVEIKPQVVFLSIKDLFINNIGILIVIGGMAAGLEWFGKQKMWKKYKEYDIPLINDKIRNTIGLILEIVTMIFKVISVIMILKACYIVIIKNELGFDLRWIIFYSYDALKWLFMSEIADKVAAFLRYDLLPIVSDKTVEQEEETKK